jgi:hypothetical protein
MAPSQVVLRVALSKEKMFYTYAHYKPDNSVFYIGKGQRKRAWSDKNRNQHWRNVVAKHGKPKIEILAQWTTEKEAFEHEKFLIWCFRDMGYSIANITNGGEGNSGLVHTDAVKQKISRIHKGKKLSVEQIEFLRQSSLGRKHSEKTKAYLTKLNKERVLTENQKQRIRSAHVGKPLSEETKKKISLAHIGKVMSIEHRAIISETHKGKKQSPEQIQKRIASRLATLAVRKQLKKEV